MLKGSIVFYDRVDAMARRALERGPSRHLSLLLAVVPLLFLAPLSGVAQYGTTFRSAPKLTSEDIEMVQKLVRQDLTGKPNGTTLAWNNPKSLNSGTVTLLQSFRSNGRECRRVRYLVKPGNNNPPGVITSTYVLTNCRLSDGTWRQDNSAEPDKTSR